MDLIQVKKLLSGILKVLHVGWKGGQRDKGDGISS